MKFWKKAPMCSCGNWENYSNHKIIITSFIAIFIQISAKNFKSLPMTAPEYIIIDIFAACLCHDDIYWI